MPQIQKISNIEALQNLTAPNITEYTSVTPETLTEAIRQNAQSITNNWHGIIVLIILSIFLFYILSKKGQYGSFRYSNIKAMGISLGITTIIGIVMINIGFLTNFKFLGVLLILYIISIVVFYIFER